MAAIITANASGVSPDIWRDVVGEMARWFINQVKGRRIIGPEEEKRFLSQLRLAEFKESSRVDKFELDINQAEAFVRRYYASNLQPSDIEQLATAVIYAHKGAVDQQNFKFTADEGQEFNAYFVAIKRHGQSVLLATSVSKFSSKFEKSYDTFLGFFGRGVNRTLTSEEKEQLNLLLIKKALKNVHANLSIPEGVLEATDQQLLSRLLGH